MGSTPFPARPRHVAALTVAEFACGPHLEKAVAIDEVCRLFLDDANRALVWCIRFRALAAWRERVDMAEWLRAAPEHEGRMCEVAASFELNDEWEFDAESFRSAVESFAR